MEALTTLKTLIDGLPNYDNSYQSFYNIIGVHDKENYNSNVLAYFFNPEAGHGLGRLWIDSLLELIKKKREDLDTSDWNFDTVQIRREQSTKEGKRIDLVISGENWAIIIENKIHHWLHNDLNNYWNSIKKKTYKVGVVLSVGATIITDKKEKKLNEKFTNILHTDLNKKVKDNLSKMNLEMEIRQRIFIEDYFNHINKLYEYQNYQKAMKEHIGDYFKHKAEIEKVVKFRNEVQNALTKAIDEIMSKNDWKNSSGNYYPKSGKPANVRFYLKNDHLVSGKLSLIFELTGKLAQSGFGEKICAKINSEWKQSEKAPMGNGHNGKSFYQLGTFWCFPFYPLPEGVSVLEHLSDLIETAFFKVPEGQTLNFVEFCMQELAELTAEKT